MSTCQCGPQSHPGTCRKQTPVTPDSLEMPSGNLASSDGIFPFPGLTTIAIKVLRCPNKTHRRQSETLMPAGLLVYARSQRAQIGTQGSKEPGS